MNRRRFFSNLFGGIVASSVAPSIIIPRLADRQLWKPTIVCVPRKLKTVWTVELEQDLAAYHSIDADRELVLIMQREIQKEIDQEILEKIQWI